MFICCREESIRLIGGRECHSAYPKTSAEQIYTNSLLNKRTWVVGSLGIQRGVWVLQIGASEKKVRIGAGRVSGEVALCPLGPLRVLQVNGEGHAHLVRGIKMVTITWYGGSE